jgi:hypothetical protein
MDFSDAMKAGGASTIMIVAVGVTYKLIQMICNHRVRSDCCGRTGSLGVEVEAWNGTPPESKKEEVFEPTVEIKTETK